MKKFIALLTQEKVKTAMNDWENDDSDILQVIHSVYKKLRQFFFYAYIVIFVQSFGVKTGQLK